MPKIWFLEVLHVEIAQKQQILVDFQLSLLFCRLIKKKYSEKSLNEFELLPPFRGT